MRIYMIGFMGAGKTHWGKLLAKKLQLPFYDLDELIVSAEGKTVTEIFDEEGEEYFRTFERDLLHKTTEKNPAMVLSCGGGTPCYFNSIEYMNDNGVTVWMNMPFEILLGRLRLQKDKRPLLRDLDDAALQAYILKKNSDRKIYYERAKVKIDDHNIKIENILNLILHA